jgi:hypothetical protein
MISGSGQRPGRFFRLYGLPATIFLRQAIRAGLLDQDPFPAKRESQNNRCEGENRTHSLLQAEDKIPSPESYRTKTSDYTLKECDRSKNSQSYFGVSVADSRMRRPTIPRPRPYWRITWRRRLAHFLSDAVANWLRVGKGRGKTLSRKSSRTSTLEIAAARSTSNSAYLLPVRNVLDPAWVAKAFFSSSRARSGAGSRERFNATADAFCVVPDFLSLVIVTGEMHSSDSFHSPLPPTHPLTLTKAPGQGGLAACAMRSCGKHKYDHPDRQKRGSASHREPRPTRCRCSEY